MPRIVIVGAGVAGICAAQTLANKLSPGDSTEVVVLEKSAFFYHTFGVTRAYTEETFAKYMFVPFDNAIPAKARGFVRFVRAVVTQIRVESSTIAYSTIDADDQPANAPSTMAFDYLILATGSNYTVPIKQDGNDYSRARTERQLEHVRDQIAQADKILVVGGGAVGCEVASDIAAHYPAKQVTLLSRQPQLVAGLKMTDTFRTRLVETLREMNVRLVLGEQLPERLAGNSFEKRVDRTDKGTVIESDIQLLCTGFSPASELVWAMDGSLVEPRGAIRVNDRLQLDDPRFPHIFALGDATNHPTPKMGYCAGRQGIHVATELAAVIRQKQTAVAKPFPLIPVHGLILPLGPDRGVTQLPFFGGWVLGDWTTRLLMSRGMLVGKVWGMLGAKVPE